MSTSNKCLSDDEHIKRLIEQAEGESNEAYQARLMTRLTGTSDTRKQQPRHEVITLVGQLVRKIDDLKRIDSDPEFLERMADSIQVIVDSLDESSGQKITSNPYGGYRGRAF